MNRKFWNHAAVLSLALFMALSVVGCTTTSHTRGKGDCCHGWSDAGPRHYHDGKLCKGACEGKDRDCGKECDKACCSDNGKCGSSCDKPCCAEKGKCDAKSGKCEKGDKSCGAGCKKACCADKEHKSCGPDCKKACCADKDKKACGPDCKKPCCADKHKDDSDDNTCCHKYGAECIKNCPKTCCNDKDGCCVKSGHTCGMGAGLGCPGMCPTFKAGCAMTSYNEEERTVHHWYWGRPPVKRLHLVETGEIGNWEFTPIWQDRLLYP